MVNEVCYAGEKAANALQGWVLQPVRRKNLRCRRTPIRANRRLPRNLPIKITEISCR